MGDCGATFAGFTLASLAILGQWSNSVMTTIAVPVLVLGIFIFDMLMITVLRIKSKRVRNFRQWLEYAGKDHISHRLHDLGLTDRQAVLVVYLAATVLGFVAFQVHSLNGLFASMLGIAGYLLLSFLFLFFLDASAQPKK